MTIEQRQLSLIRKVKSFFKKNEEKDFDISSSGISYFCSFSECTGFAFLKLWDNNLKNFIKFTKIIVKEILSISNLKNYKFYFEKNIKSDFDKIIVTWGSHKNFLKDGSYFDSYFRTKSEDIKNSIWFIIYLDQELPEIIPKNIVILKRDYSRIFYNPFFFIKIFIKNLIKSKFSIKYFFYSMSWHSQFSVIVNKHFKKLLNHKVKNIIMPYESQTFQNVIIKEAKKFNPKIISTGYIHSFPSLPTHFIYNKLSPNNLILNSKDQMNCFEKNLNWHTAKLKYLPSSRFSKDSSFDMKNYIFLPIDFISKNKIVFLFEKLINSSTEYDFSELKIRNHPHKINSKKHQQLSKDLHELIKKNNHDKNRKKLTNHSVFVGATGSIVEALEKGISVFHLCEDPVFESYHGKLWPSIEVREIRENILIYNLSKKGNLIKFGDNKVFENLYL